jgi:hypothetical protein
MRIRCEHAIPLPVDAFWEMLHAPRYEAAVADALGLLERAAVSLVTDAYAKGAEVAAELGAEG